MTETKVRENVNVLPVPKSKDIKVTENTVILDARPFFQYSSAHLPQAYPIRWEDFSQASSPIKGVLDPDAFALARRLARLGITPDSEVIVVGNGRQGQGEEGRIAWTLAYLGIQNVQFSKEEHLTGKRLAGPAGIVKNAPIWKPKVKHELMASTPQLLAAAKQITQATSPLILDVRPPQEYLKKNAAQVDLGAINIDWKEFFDEQGRPRKGIIKDLHGLGIGANRQIIVISDDGVRSAAVAMALKELGYETVANYAPGLKGLSTKAKQ